MPSLQHPAAFLFLLLIPILYILRKCKIFKRITFPIVFADWGGGKFEWKGKSQKIFSAISNVILVLGFILIITAMTDPVISHQEKVYTSLGTDICFVVDVSPSMSAADINEMPRLDAAKNTIKKMMTNQDGVRLGIVTFGSNASVFVPPTTNHAFVQEKIEEMKFGMLGNGSAVGDGLSTAICHLVSSSAPKKCIILLTDGENNSGSIHPETAANLAKQNNIPIYVVGIGSKGRFAIEYQDPVDGKTYSGEYDSSFNSQSLRKIASISEGRYFEVKTMDDFVNTINGVIKSEAVVQNFTYKTVNDIIYDKFLAWGLIFLGIGWVIKRMLLHEVL